MKDHLRDLLTRTIDKAAKGGELAVTELPPLILESPKQKEFGDLSTNVALLWAKQQKKSPRAIAETLLRNLEDPEGILQNASVAGPGFLNFSFSPKFCYRCLKEVEERNGRVENLGQGNKIQVEFASVNPTGPLHVGHGRVAVIGDVLARLLEEVGYQVEREYYVNDSGKQIENLGLSIYHRYRELYGKKEKFPEDGYLGDYVRDLAATVKERWGDRCLSEKKDAAIKSLSRFGADEMLSVIRDDLGGFGITFDSFFSEKGLRDRGEVKQTMELLASRELLYQQDGAHWFKAQAFGDDKDRTVIKSDGDLTYFACDIAYHRNKFERGFTKMVNIWGADHHGYVGRLKAAIQAMGYDSRRLQVILVQLVQLTRGGTSIKMGKRSGEFVSLREVLEEVGSDAARFFFLMRRSGSHLDFDLDLAKKNSAENPVFYVQYAHARIASIFEQAGKNGVQVKGLKVSAVELEKLSLAEELEMIKKVVQFSDVVRETVEDLEPHQLVFYLLELAGQFHRYYNRYRVISSDMALTRARLLLVQEVQKVIRKGLQLLGVGAPMKMARTIPEGELNNSPSSDASSAG
ncbi:MAG: arginine--tRNA ligase [Deltaproteobacteria bacterium]|nr:arginine--tRNA ligase [Deltaproteobacteria bacterium]